ncbi:MAG: DNA translocase FtsK [Oscillospiraceae bacterium]|nr:DNA translocase FtsK [Oscillospiraceae bacterium]
MAEKKPTAKEKITALEQAKENKSKLWSIGLFFSGLLSFCLVFIDGTSGWLAIHNFLRGIFGIGVITLPILLCYTSVKIAKDKNADTIPRRLFASVGIMLLVCGFIQIYTNNINENLEFGEKLKMLYINGKDLKGGGFVSALVAMSLIGAFGNTGAIIIVSLLLLVFLMLFTNTSPIEFFRLCTAPFRYLAGRERKSKVEFSTNGENTAAKERKTKVPKPKKESVWSKEYKKQEEQVSDGEEMLELPFDISEPIDAPFKDKKSNKHSPQAPQQETLIDEETEELIRKSLENKAKNTKISVEEVLDIQREVTANKVIEQVEYIKPYLTMLKQGVNNSDDAQAIEEMRMKADLLIDTLKSFGVEVRITGVFRGPAVTRYEVQPAAGVKVSKITSLSDDIALNLAAKGIRMEAPIPGKSAVGIEVPNTNKDIVSLRDVLESDLFKTSKSKLSFAVGKDISGNIVVGDVAKMPHLIIAGSTGSGKSVCTNSIIMSILYHSTPEEVRLILVDPKIVEFKIYDGIPHLLIPVVTDPRKAAGALNWAVNEMERRYKIFAENNVRELSEYNAKIINDEIEGTKLPQILIAVDEFADLMMTASKEVEESVCRLAQKARAAGMHIILATQRPTTNVITGLIKANIPSRIALSVMAQIDSRTILDTGGAEKLLGYGDMLYLPNGTREPVRIQGCFCSTKEIEGVVNFIKAQGEAHYSEEIMNDIERSAPLAKGEVANDDDTYLDGDGDIMEKVIKIAVDNGQLSTSMIQRKLKLGYNRAARIVDELEEQGIVGPVDGAKPRRVLITPQQYMERRNSK